MSGRLVAGFGCVALCVVALALVCSAGVVAWFGFDSVRTARSGDVLNATTPVRTTGIELRDNRFVPTVISVKAGETITWVNAGTVQHNVVFRRNGPSSVYLKPGETYALSLPTTGVFDYACSLHSGMVGRVIVAAPIR